jgi:hypothetical protein
VSEPNGEFPKCTEDDQAWRKEFSPGALLWVTLLGQARKVTRRIFILGKAVCAARQSDELPKKDAHMIPSADRQGKPVNSLQIQSII